MYLYYIAVLLKWCFMVAVWCVSSDFFYTPPQFCDESWEAWTAIQKYIMEDDFKPLLSSENPEEYYSHRGSTESLDFKAKRWISLKFYDNTLTYTVRTRTVLAYCLFNNTRDFYLFTGTLRTLVNKYQTTESESHSLCPGILLHCNSYSFSDKNCLYRWKLFNSQCSLTWY